jgi:hypothetical protein
MLKVLRAGNNISRGVLGPDPGCWRMDQIYERDFGICIFVRIRGGRFRDDKRENLQRKKTFSSSGPQQQCAETDIEPGFQGLYRRLEIAEFPKPINSVIRIFEHF